MTTYTVQMVITHNYVASWDYRDAEEAISDYLVLTRLFPNANIFLTAIRDTKNK